MYRSTDAFAEHAYGEHLHNEDEARWMELEKTNLVPPTPMPYDAYWAIMTVAVVSIVTTLIVFAR